MRRTEIVVTGIVGLFLVVGFMFWWPLILFVWRFWFG